MTYNNLAILAIYLSVGATLTVIGLKRARAPSATPLTMAVAIISNVIAWPINIILALIYLWSQRRTIKIIYDMWRLSKLLKNLTKSTSQK